MWAGRGGGGEKGMKTPQTTQTTSGSREQSGETPAPPQPPQHPPWHPGAAGRWCSRPRRTWSAACGSRPVGRGHAVGDSTRRGDGGSEVTRGVGAKRDAAEREAILCRDDRVGDTLGSRISPPKAPSPLEQMWPLFFCMGDSLPLLPGDRRSCQGTSILGWGGTQASLPGPCLPTSPPAGLGRGDQHQTTHW